MAVPRLAQRVGFFAFFYVPEQFDGLLGRIRNGGSIIAQATSEAIMNATNVNPTSFVQGSTVASSKDAPGAGDSMAASQSLFSIQNIMNLGGVFSYITSRWALTTFTVVS